MPQSDRPHRRFIERELAGDLKVAESPCFFIEDAGLQFREGQYVGKDEVDGHDVITITS